MYCSCREKQRKEATRLVSVNAKLTALNKLLMEENERLAKHASQLTLDNHALRQQLPNLPVPDGKCRLSGQVSLSDGHYLRKRNWNLKVKRRSLYN